MKKNNCQKKKPAKKKAGLSAAVGWQRHQMERGIKDGFVRLDFAFMPNHLVLAGGPLSLLSVLPV